MARGRITRKAIEGRFSTIGVNDQEMEACENIATFYKETADNISEILPEGRYKNMAITSLEEAMYWSQRAMVDGIRYTRPANYQ